MTLPARYGLYVLGAGFSKAAGLPLAHQLWSEIRERIRSMSGRASRFDRDLEDYLEFRRICFHETVHADAVDFEDFIGFLDFEHFLGLRGNNTWSEAGNETQVLVKTLIGQVLTEATPSLVPDLYLKFAEILRPGDRILTFNYDILLERALQHIRKPFRLFPDRYSRVHQGVGGNAEIDDSLPEIVVLKLHGSIDWFDRREHRELTAWAMANGLQPPAGYPLFGTEAQLCVFPLVDGPRFEDDPLTDIFRLPEIELFYRSPPFFRISPFLLNPSPVKIIYVQPLKEFWSGLGETGVLNFDMAIIGYSLPVHDDYARQVLYRMVRNYQGKHFAGSSVFNCGEKSPLRIIDFRASSSDEEQFKNAYSFVDWNHCKAHFSGLDLESVEMLRQDRLC